MLTIDASQLHAIRPSPALTGNRWLRILTLCSLYTRRGSQLRKEEQHVGSAVKLGRTLLKTFNRPVAILAGVLAIAWVFFSRLEALWSIQWLIASNMFVLAVLMGSMGLMSVFHLGLMAFVFFTIEARPRNPAARATPPSQPPPPPSQITHLIRKSASEFLSIPC